MQKVIAGVIFVYFGVVIGWLILAGTVDIRTNRQDDKLKTAVGRLWGVPQNQEAPTLFYTRAERTPVERTDGKRKWRDSVTTETTRPVTLEPAS
jgi:hypothetical protein